MSKKDNSCSFSQRSQRKEREKTKCGKYFGSSKHIRQQDKNQRLIKKEKIKKKDKRSK